MIPNSKITSGSRCWIDYYSYVSHEVQLKMNISISRQALKWVFHVNTYVLVYDISHPLYFQQVKVFEDLYPNITEYRRSILSNSSCYSTLSTPNNISSADYLSIERYSVYFFFAGISYSAWGSKSSDLPLLKRLLDPRQLPFPKKFIPFLKKTFNNEVINKVVIPHKEIWPAIEDELLLCEKSVYVGTKQDTESYKDYFKKKYPTAKRFHISRDSIRVAITGWNFPIDQSHTFVRGFKNFLDFGIYNELLWFEKYNHVGKNNVSVDINKTELNGVSQQIARGKTSEGMQNVFLVWMGGLAISVIVEIMYQIFERSRLTAKKHQLRRYI